MNGVVQCKEYLTDTKDEEMERKEKIIAELKSRPVFPQKSAEWFRERNNCITATKIPTVCNEDPYAYPIEVIFDKCGVGKIFEENENTHHGTMCEMLADKYYSYRNNVKIGEHGVYRHPKYKFIGASPDGICDIESYDGTQYSKLVGRLIEIKFPLKRRINTTGEVNGEICPHQYYVQVQTQMFVTGLFECDFIQVKSYIYKSNITDINDNLEDLCEQYRKDESITYPGITKKNGLEMGMMIELINKDVMNNPDLSTEQKKFKAIYEYQPRLYMTLDELIEWYENYVETFNENPKSKIFEIVRPVFWRFDFVKTITIKYEDNYIENRLPLIRQFWTYILFYRKNHDKLLKLKKYADKIGYDQSKRIFKRIHIDYSSSLDKPTKTKPLYRHRNKWRKQFDEKKLKYSQYNNTIDEPIDPTEAIPIRRSKNPSN